MPVYEIRFYSGTGNWVCEGRGYWLSSVGEFSKLIEDYRLTTGRYFDSIDEFTYLDGGRELRKIREKTPEEWAIHTQMAAVLKALTESHSNFTLA